MNAARSCQGNGCCFITLNCHLANGNRHLQHETVVGLLTESQHTLLWILWNTQRNISDKALLCDFFAFNRYTF